ncbi:MAG: hypothetical protein MUO31_15580 [Thermodesulfovibrionales bacterium]|nr:hypothetical protein [Thermodesulfovibrionales bacterium]
MKKKLVLLIAAVMATSMPTSVLYAKSGVSDNTALPNGKPFQTIQTTLDSLQSQIFVLVGATETTEARLDALEAAVLALQERDAELLILIENNDGDIADLEAEVAGNTALIVAMQIEVDDLTATVALKQNIIDGTCPSGEFLVAVNEDGSVMCRTDEIGTVGTLSSYRAFNYIDLSMANPFGDSDYGTVSATCDTGYTLTGGGFDTDSDMVYVYSSLPSGKSWSVTAINNTPFVGTSIQVYATCIRLN